jgi:hypothetical protein
MPELCMILGDTNFHLQNRLTEHLFPDRSAQMAVQKTSHGGAKRTRLRGRDPA